MKEVIEKLHSYDDDKLSDIIKNYRQYGYNEDIRKACIEIMESRGVEMETLKLRGDYVNFAYDEALFYYKHFDIASKVAFILYGLILIIRILFPIVARDSIKLLPFLAIVFWLSFVGYFISIVRSFVSQARYYKTINKADAQLNPIGFFTLGLVAYGVMYFIFRKQIKEEMKKIR